MRVSLKSIKVNSALSNETASFSAAVYLDGRKIGTVSNRGDGACNSYYFPKREDRDAFMGEVREWAKQTGYKRVEPEDALIAHLMERADFEKHARTNAKKGFPVTLVCRRGKDEFGWIEVWTVGLQSEQQIPLYVKREKVEDHEVVRPG